MMIDLNPLRTLLKGNEALMLQSLRLLYDACREHLAGLNRAIQDGNMPAVSGNAHSLKSKLAYLGHTYGVALAKDIEMKAKHESRVSDELRRMSEEFTGLVSDVILVVVAEIDRMS